MGQVTASLQVASERQVRENEKVSARSKPQKDGGQVESEAREGAEEQKQGDRGVGLLNMFSYS